MNLNQEILSEVKNRIISISGKNVILDTDVAALYVTSFLKVILYLIEKQKLAEEYSKIRFR